MTKKKRVSKKKSATCGITNLKKVKKEFGVRSRRYKALKERCEKKKNKRR